MPEVRVVVVPVAGRVVVMMVPAAAAAAAAAAPRTRHRTARGGERLPQLLTQTALVVAVRRRVDVYRRELASRRG